MTTLPATMILRNAKPHDFPDILKLNADFVHFLSPMTCPVEGVLRDLGTNLWLNLPLDSEFSLKMLQISQKES